MKHNDLDPLEIHPWSEKTLNGFTTEQSPLTDHYVSYSRVSLFKKSPMHFKWKYIDGNREVTSDSMAFGKIVHKALLEPSLFKKLFAIAPNKDSVKDVLNTLDDLKGELTKLGLKKSGRKEELADRLVEHDPKYKKRIFFYIEKEFKESLGFYQIVIKEDESDSIVMMIQNIQNHQSAGMLVRNGRAELAAYWYDEELGFLWFVKLDYLRVVENPKTKKVTAWLTELKTAKSANPLDFRRDIDNMGYHMQLWIYKRVVQGLLGKDVDVRANHIVIENKEPHIVEVFKPAERMMTDAAGYQVRSILKRMQHCLDSDIWPGYTDGSINEIDLPPYAYYRLEEEEESLLGDQ